MCLTSTETIRLIEDGEKGAGASEGGMEVGGTKLRFLGKHLLCARSEGCTHFALFITVTGVH